MERLTFEGNFCDIAQCDATPGGSYCESGSCTQRKVWERLKQFEDKCESPEVLAKAMDMEEILGDEYYSVDRMLELLKADKAGRLVVLPCKVGDMLYEVTGRKTISVYKVKAIRVELFSLFVEGDIAEGFVWQCLNGINAKEIGKTVFLTREEAKKALEAMKDG